MEQVIFNPKGAYGLPADSSITRFIAQGATAPSTRLSTDMQGLIAGNTVVTLGTSITANNIFSSAGSYGFQSTGYFTWANYYLRGRFFLLNNAGISGDTLPNMVSRLKTDVLDFNPAWCIVEAGTNDVSAGVAAETVLSQLYEIYNRLRANGIRVVATTILPKTNINSTALRTILNTVNRGIKAYCLINPDVVLCDWHAYLADATTGDPVTNITSDGTHPAITGARRMGLALFNVLDTQLPKVDILTNSFHDSAVNGGNLLVNGLMNGNAAGFATSWSNPDAGTSTPTKVARTDFIAGEWQQMACVSGLSSVFQQNTNVGTDWSIGDLIYGAAEIEFDSAGFTPTPPNSSKFGLLITFFGPSTVLSCVRAASSDLQLFTTDSPGNGVLITPIFPVPTTTTRLQFKVQYDGAGTFRVGRCGMWKVATNRVL